LLWLSEGDAPKRFFHVQATHRCHKNFIQLLEHQGRLLVVEDRKAEAAFNFFNDILGAPIVHSTGINLELLELNRLDLAELGGKFTEEEVLGVIQSLPSDKALGPDGFTGRFLQSTWHIIRVDLILALDAFWHLDTPIVFTRSMRLS
jgi:hypothetical protein